MKKLVSLILSVLLVFSAYPLTTNAHDVSTNSAAIYADTLPITLNSTLTAPQIPFIFEPPITRYDWGGLEPVKLTGVTYQLADNVVEVNSEVTQSISKTGFLSMDKIKAATGTSNVKPGTVFVDFANRASYAIPTLPAKTNDQYNNYVPVVKPDYRSVFKDFNIPNQHVKLNQANIANFENSTDKYLKKPGQTYVMSHDYESTMDPIKPTHLSNPLAEFYFPKDTTVSGSTPSGGQVSVTINGYLGIGDITLDGDYDIDSYQFYFSIANEMQLQVSAAASLNEEIRIPILGVDIGFDNDIGSIAGGLFIVVGVNGEFTIQMEMRQWTTIAKAGLKGKNFLGVPYTIRPLFEMGDSGFDLDSRFNGAVSGYVKGGALIELNLLGIDLIGAGVFAGMGASSVVSGDYVETDLYGLLQAYIKFIGKHKNIINWQPTIMHKRQMNTAGYDVTFKEACAYRDEVWGTIEYDYGAYGGYKREPDKDFILVVQDTNGIEKEYSGYTDANGDFHLSNIPLRKDYKVYIRIRPKNGGDYVKSENVVPTFPFNKVTLLESDFFNDYVKGYVPTAIVKDWSTGEDEEIKFELNYNNATASSLNVNLSNITDAKPVYLESSGNFALTSENILPGTSATCKLTYDEFEVVSNSINPTVQFELLSNRIPVSFSEITENGKPVDVSKLSQTLSVVNMRGTKQYVGNAVHTLSPYTQHSIFCYITNPDTGLPVLQQYGLPDQTGSVSFSADSDPSDEEYGTSSATNTVIRKWFWEPAPAAAPTRQVITTPIITAPTNTTAPTTITPRLPIIRPGATIAPTATPAPTAPAATTAPTATIAPTVNINQNILGNKPILPIYSDLLDRITTMPQNTYTMSFDDLVDRYEDYYDNYSGWVDGSSYIKWDDKVVFNYEGVDITLEFKDNFEKRSNTGSKFETIPADWTGKNIDSMLNRYLDEMQGSLVFPMVDQVNKVSSISNIAAVPAWAATSVQKMVSTGIMDLSSGATFKSGNATRSECAAYLVKAFGISPLKQPSAFADIVPANPYIPEINAAVKFGIINGYSASEFGPGDPVTREQMAAMTMRGLKIKYGSRLQIPNNPRTFTDRDSFSTWSRTAIDEISSLGIMNGYTDGSFGPKGNITFNEMAVMLDNLSKLLTQLGL